MPNGRYQLDCCYCQNWRSDYSGPDGMYDPGFCSLFKVEIPSSDLTGLHRICGDFRPNESYDRFVGNLVGPTVEERMAWFGPLQRGILYGFGYNTPNEVSVLKHLEGEQQP